MDNPEPRNPKWVLPEPSLGMAVVGLIGCATFLLVAIIGGAQLVVDLFGYEALLYVMIGGGMFCFLWFVTWAYLAGRVK